MGDAYKYRWDRRDHEGRAYLRIVFDDVTVAAIIYDPTSTLYQVAIRGPAPDLMTVEFCGNGSSLEDVVRDAEGSMRDVGYTLTETGVAVTPQPGVKR